MALEEKVLAKHGRVRVPHQLLSKAELNTAKHVAVCIKDIDSRLFYVVDSSCLTIDDEDKIVFYATLGRKKDLILHFYNKRFTIKEFILYVENTTLYIKGF